MGRKRLYNEKLVFKHMGFWTNGVRKEELFGISETTLTTPQTEFSTIIQRAPGTLNILSYTK